MSELIQPTETRPFRSPSTSMSLLGQARAGSREAWEKIVFLYSPFVYTWCRREGLKEHDIRDVGQDVFAVLFTKLDKFHKTEPSDSFRKWLKTITRNKVTDFRRRENRQPDARGGTSAQIILETRAIAPPVSEPDPSDDHDEESDLVLLMRRCLEMVKRDFDARTWEAFCSVVMDHRAPAEVAAALGITKNAVYLAKSKILKRLRETLDQLEETSFVF